MCVRTLDEYLQMIYCLFVYYFIAVINVLKEENRILLEDKVKPWLSCEQGIKECFSKLYLSGGLRDE